MSELHSVFDCPKPMAGGGYGCEDCREFCDDCGKAEMGSSPTGDWCNNCGWAYPGYLCEICGRESVNEEHLNLVTGDRHKTLLKRINA